MLKLSTNKGTRLLLCGSYPETRGLKNIELVKKNGNQYNGSVNKIYSRMRESFDILV
jgi:hypothetical protein